VTVRASGAPVRNLNELEVVKGEILANVWMTSRIARISPKTGDVIWEREPKEDVRDFLQAEIGGGEDIHVGEGTRRMAQR
jgi:glutamine cyclotransferase